MSASFFASAMVFGTGSPHACADYGTVLLLAAIACFLLTKILIGRDRKGKTSVVVYAAAIPLSFVQPWIACACYTLVAVL